MDKRMVKAVSGFLAGMLCVSAFGMNTFAEWRGDFDVRDINSGYAIAGVRDSGVKGGQVVIPDEIDGIPVTQLGAKDKTSTFLGQNGITRLVIGKNVRGATTTAFYGAEDLKEIEISPENKGTLAFDKDEGVLRAMSGGNGILVKYLSGNERKSYRVPDGISRIFNMDHGRFDTLDLNQVTSVEHISFADTEIDTLVVGNAAVHTSPDILYGASVGKFDTAGSTLYGSDGKALWQEGRLIKVSAGADFPDGYFERFDSISPYAFQSIAQYQNLKAKVPEKLTRDVVFSFYHQNAAVFMVNGQVSFCYNYNLGVPTSVGNPVDYSQDMDGEKYEKVKALMYVGVPYDGTGLFEKVFGMEYKEVSSDSQVMEHGDAALNAVSAVLYETLDGIFPDEIRGVGYGMFTEEKVKEYLSGLREAVEGYPQYQFTPKFSVNGGALSFHRVGNGYESDGFTVDTVDGNGSVNASYRYTLHITTPGMRVKDTGEKSFETGSEVILVSETVPSEISVSYQEPSLKFYKRTSSGVQDVLCSAVEESQGALETAILVHDLVISKQDITTGKELPGAELILTNDGKEIDWWISGETPHGIENPEDGGYVLTEVTAPEGYELAESITFEVKDGETVGGKVVMYVRPVPKEVYISKQDMATGRELPGAELTLSKDGSVMEQWISGDIPHILRGLLDGVYVLTEVTAPKGYEIAESITFEVVNGEVKGGPVVMKDKRKAATPSDAVPATPSDATPATPSDAVPSQPEKPDKPDVPVVEEKPSKPENPSGGGGQSSGGGSEGGHRRITGSSTSGPGVPKPEAVNMEVYKPEEPFPAKIPETEKNYVLPKTGDRSVESMAALVSFLLLIVLVRKKRGDIKDSLPK